MEVHPLTTKSQISERSLLRKGRWQHSGWWMSFFQLMSIMELYYKFHKSTNRILKRMGIMLGNKYEWVKTHGKSYFRTEKRRGHQWWQRTLHESPMSHNAHCEKNGRNPRLPSLTIYHCHVLLRVRSYVKERKALWCRADREKETKSTFILGIKYQATLFL